MCEAMTAITYAALAAGTAAKYAAAQKSSKAMQAVQQLEADRQEKLNKEADALLSKSIGDNSRMSVDTEIEENKNKRIADMNAAVDAIPLGDAVSRLGETGKNRLVQAESAAREAEGKAVNKGVGEALASIGSFADTNLNRGIMNARGLQQTGMIGNFKRGSGQVANIENETASHAGDNLAMLGDLLNSVAVISGGYAAQGTTPWMTAAEKADAIAKMAAAGGSTAGSLAQGASIGATLLGPYAGRRYGPLWPNIGTTTPAPAPWRSGYVVQGQPTYVEGSIN